MTRRNVPDNHGLSSTHWLAGRFVLLGGILVTMLVPPISPASAAQVDAGTSTATFPVTQPAPATQSAPATSIPASHPGPQPATQPAVASASQPREPDLAPEMIDSYKKQVQAAQDIPDPERDNVLKMYDKALDLLKVADNWQAQASKADDIAKQVPDQLEKANAKLKQPVEDLTPHVPDGATLQQIGQLCKDAEELDRAARLDTGSLLREQQSCKDRAQTIQNRRNAIRLSLADLAEQINALHATAAADQAQRILLRAQRRALYRELNALEKQRACDDTRQELLTVQIQLASRYQDATDSALAAWQDILKQRRAAEAAKVAAQASQKSLSLRDRPELFEIAEQNKELSNRRIDLQNLADDIQRTIEPRDAIAARRRALAADSQGMMKRIETAGLTEAVSSSLRRHRAQLPDIVQHERNVRRLESEIAKAQIELIDLEDQRSTLVANTDRQVEQILKGLKKSVAPQDRDTVRTQIRDLLQTKLTYLGDLIRDYNAATTAWFEQQEEERFLIADTRKYADYIDEHILWVRSTHPLQLVHIRYTWHAALWFVDPTGWIDAGRGLLADLQANPLVIFTALLLFTALLALRQRFRQRLHQIDEIAAKGYSYAFVHTLQAMGLTVLLALPWPGLLWFVGRRLSWTVTTDDFVGALGAGLRAAGALYFALELIRQVCRKKGLGQTHFHWPSPAMQLLRVNLAWLIPVALPLTFVHYTVDWQVSPEYRDSLGRLAFIAGMIALAVFTRRVLQPAGPLMADFLQRHRDGSIDRLRFLWYPLAVAVPAVLALAAALGYYYTAMQLATRLLATIGLVLTALVAKALLLRMLFVARRRLALDAIDKRKTALTHPQTGAQPRAAGLAAPVQVDAETSAPLPAPEPEIDLAAVDAQTRRLVRVAVLLGLLLGLYFTWVDMLPALGILDRVQLWSTTVDVSQPITNTDGSHTLTTVQKLVPITLGSVAWAGLIVLIALAAARNIPGLLELTVLRLMPLEPGGRYAVNAISRYIITILGLVIAFGAIGLGWSKVQWLAAAVTVGLGFGLQEIFANFVSGIIILFERPVRVGDVISIGEISGTVARIRIRATTIIDWNRKELIVPNKQFITSQMVNWTLSDSILRLVISVGVPYGSDPDVVRNLLLRVARDNPHVLATPKPSAFLLSVTNASLEFSLRVFVPSPDMILGVQDELHTAIDQALRQAGIEVTFSRSPG